MEHIRIIAPGDPGFDWLYDLYMQSFPVHEQRLRERQEGVLGHPEYHCDLLWVADQTNMSFSFIVPLLSFIVVLLYAWKVKQRSFC